MTRTNILTDILEVNHPIVQAPMLGVSTPEMTAAVSNEGGLGSLAVGGLPPEATRELIRKTRTLTDRPFAVNLFAHDIPAYTDEDMAPMRNLLLRLADERGYHLDPAELTNFRFYNHLDQIDILVEEGVSLVSFTFGCLDPGSIRTLKQNDCTLIGTATTVEEALFLQEQHIDIVVVQGIEAGGHRGTFLGYDRLPQIGLFALLPQVRNAVSIPCIAAGGIRDVQTIRSAFELGADGVQIGTAFIGTRESSAVASYKDRVTKAKDTDTALTKAFSGRWARGLRNRLMQEIEQAGIPVLPYPLQNGLIAKFRKVAQQHNDSDYTTLWAGQSAGKIETIPAGALFRKLAAEYEAAVSRGL